MKKNSTKKTKVGWIVFGIIVAVILIVGIVGYVLVRNLFNQVNTVTVDERQLSAEKEDDVINIALYGIDSDYINDGRSDVIMVFSIDPNKKTCRLCSIMRDAYVKIEGHGMDKINHAYAFGGPELAMKTLNQNFGLNITHFASVDFSTLPEIIDLLGCISLEITAEEAATGSIPDIYEAGNYDLTGEQALGYCRIRYATGNDFQRTQRQRNVINGMLNRIFEKSVSEWPAIAATLLPMITTNYSGDEIMELIAQYGTYAQHGIKETRFPVDGTYEGKMIEDVFYLVFDIPAQAKMIQDFVFKGIFP